MATFHNIWRDFLEVEKNLDVGENNMSSKREISRIFSHLKNYFYWYFWLWLKIIQNRYFHIYQRRRHKGLNVHYKNICSLFHCEFTGITVILLPVLVFSIAGFICHLGIIPSYLYNIVLFNAQYSLNNTASILLD